MYFVSLMKIIIHAFLGQFRTMALSAPWNAQLADFCKPQNVWRPIAQMIERPDRGRPGYHPSAPLRRGWGVCGAPRAMRKSLLPRTNPLLQGMENPHRQPAAIFVACFLGAGYGGNFPGFRGCDSIPHREPMYPVRRPPSNNYLK
jgi:hypothetical protein